VPIREGKKQTKNKSKNKQKQIKKAPDTRLFCLDRIRTHYSSSFPFRTRSTLAVSESVGPTGHEDPPPWPPPSVVTPAWRQAFFHVSDSRHARSHSFCSFSFRALRSEIACSVNSFSTVHFSMFEASFSLSCWMYWTARCRIEPLFFSHPGTILASSLIPSLIVSLRRRSTAKD